MTALAIPRTKRTLHPYPRDSLRSVAVLGTYVPRRCGIATFTADLVAALRQEAPDSRFDVVALNDRRDGFDYPDEVRFEINERQLQDYRAAADFLNANRVDAVSVQHEFGIFGGLDGSHLLKLIGNLRTPVVTTMHTVLNAPTPSQRAVVREIGARSDRIVVMSETSRGFLTDVYAIPPERVRVVPHGIPDVPFVDPNFYKDQFSVAGRKVLLTFGLLSRNKGIEGVIQALPKIARRHADAVYIVLGATHPQVRKTEGESYRIGLQQLARRLGVADRVHFHDRFVELQELIEFLGAADVYVTPYVHAEQSTSGTLAYAMGAGKAVVSTRYWHAEEMLADGRGRLVPCGDSEALADAVIALFDDEPARHAMRKRAYTYTRDHVWSEVARRYLEVFAELRHERSLQPRPARAAVARERFEALPEIDLRHLKRLTDDTGIQQHAKYHVPDRREGYCTDDNARALLIAMQAAPFVVDATELEELAVRYLAFLRHAFDEATGSFRNFMGFDRRFAAEPGSPDCQGRAIWALGTVAASVQRPGLRALATRLLHDALPLLERLSDLRPMAYAQLGLVPYLVQHGGDSAIKRARQMLAERLFAAFAPFAPLDRGAASPDPAWPWPEPALTYGNTLLPQALMESGEQLGRRDMIDRGISTLQWLMAVQTRDGRFAPIGNQGWFPRGGTCARFDQQPIEAGAAVTACAAAFRITGEDLWLERALQAFRWFLGENDLAQPLYDPTTGGCRDGLQANGLNENQGGESTLAWLAALGQVHALEASGQLGGRIAAAAAKGASAAAGEAAAI